MARVIITRKLKEEIIKKFKKESVNIFSLMLTLEDDPKKGKFLGKIGGIVLKELKYKKFRFYFLTDNFKVKYLMVEELKDLVIRFIRMSEKKDQKKVINEIKQILKKTME